MQRQFSLLQTPQVEGGGQFRQKESGCFGIPLAEKIKPSIDKKTSNKLKKKCQQDLGGQVGTDSLLIQIL